MQKLSKRVSEYFKGIFKFMLSNKTFRLIGIIQVGILMCLMLYLIVEISSISVIRGLNRDNLMCLTQIDELNLEMRCKDKNRAENKRLEAQTIKEEVKQKEFITKVVRLSHGYDSVSLVNLNEVCAVYKFSTRGTYMEKSKKIHELGFSEISYTRVNSDIHVLVEHHGRIKKLGYYASLNDVTEDSVKKVYYKPWRRDLVIKKGMAYVLTFPNSHPKDTYKLPKDKKIILLVLQVEKGLIFDWDFL